MKRSALLTLCTVAVLGCDPGTPPPAGPRYDDDAAAGKADGAAAVELTPADESLGSTSLRKTICAEIVRTHPFATSAQRNGFSDGCLDHKFTIVEFATSTKLAHLDDGDAMTMAMRVDVNADPFSFETRLVRDFDSATFNFRWRAEVIPGPIDAARQTIEALADEMGEFFSPDDAPDSFEFVKEVDVPAIVLEAARERVAEIDEDMGNVDPHQEFGSAFLSDEGIWRIIDNGKTIGFVFPVEFFIDHPLFDGGGTTLYYDAEGGIVEEIDWFG